MNCLDCAGAGVAAEAVGTCHDCGSGVCAQHARVLPRWLTRIAVINRVERVEPPGRLLLCPVCEAARSAAGAAPVTADRRHGASTR